MRKIEKIAGIMLVISVYLLFISFALLFTPFEKIANCTIVALGASLILSIVGYGIDALMRHNELKNNKS